MLYARSKPMIDNNGEKSRTVTACGGLTFVSYEYRPVPAHEEESALKHPLLETTNKPPKPAPKKSAMVSRRNDAGTVKFVTKVPESFPDFVPVHVETEEAK